ncbi:hypothetical protein [Gottfriedia luciferensis]|uniref:hypothetical protein n=1 Tax=Gottfriedia luciferensis TaxID=178774 RepID=UPI000B45428A|nr:hypothetical protein [Gottfriedia luciferensis]
MNKRYFFLLFLSMFLLMTACTSINTSNETVQPKKVVIKQTKEIWNWDIKVIPRLNHKKWVYDTSITYLGEKTVPHLVVLNYDQSKLEYDNVKPHTPLKTFGSYDYEGSVFSNKKNQLSFTLTWSEGYNNYSKIVVFKIKPKY